MKNTRLVKMAAVAIALLALTGCNAAKTAIENKAKDVIQNTAKDVAQNLGNNQEAKPAENTDNSGNEATNVGNDNSGSKTNVDDCMKGCGILTGTGMFSKAFCQDSCWASVAKDTGDVTICDSKIDQTNSLVLFACYLNVAETNKDAKFCDKIGKDSSDFMRGGCYGNVAKVKKDPSVCDPAYNGTVILSRIL